MIITEIRRSERHAYNVLLCSYNLLHRPCYRVARWRNRRLQRWLTKTRRFFMPIPCGELRPQGKQVPAIPPSSTPLACYASRFPAPRNIHSLTHSLTTPPIYTIHSLATTTATATATTTHTAHPPRRRERYSPAPFQQLFKATASTAQASRVPALTRQGEHIATESSSRTVLEDCAATARAGITLGISTAE